MSQDNAVREQSGQPLIVANGFFPVPVPTGHLVEAYDSAGFDAMAMPFRLDDMMDVASYAKHIALAVRWLHDRSGRKVDIVGISMGGIAALFAVKHLDAARFVRTLVLAGSPIKGTPISSFGEWTCLFRKVGRQLSFESRLLKKLRERPLPEGPRYISVSGIFDFISPPSTSTLEDAENHILAFQHHDLMFTPWVHHKIAEIILE